MYSKFPFSMEKIPRQRSFACLSLKFGSILTALINILYTVLALSQCVSMLMYAGAPSQDTDQGWIGYGFVITSIIVHSISFAVSALMLLGALRDKASLIKPWVVWKSMVLAASALVFVLYSTMNVITQFQDSALLVYVTEFFSLLIRFYMLTIVASFHKQLIEESSETERLRDLISNDTWYTEA